MEQIKSCPVCGAEAFSQYLNCIDYTVSMDEFNIVECQQCSFRFTNPRPNAVEIIKYYQSDAYISHSNSKVGLLNNIYQSVRNYTIKKKINLINKHVSRGTILDIGCGTGEFLYQMKKNEWATVGIEPGNQARNFAVTNYSLPVFEEAHLNTLKDGSFEVITMWHVLEHVHELNQRIETIKRLIKNDGVVIIAVPNHLSYDAQKYKNFWAAYDLPRHLYHFTPQTIRKLFDKHKFKLIKTLPMYFDSFYVSLLSEKYKKGNVNYLSAILSGLVSNTKAMVSENDVCSSQIYIFKKA